MQEGKSKQCNEPTTTVVNLKCRRDSEWFSALFPLKIDSQLKRQTIFSYPLYRRGNPQLRVYLPNFWMKLLNPEKMSHKKPPNSIMFEVSPAMTRLDVKNYLEKIYKVIYMWIDLFPITRIIIYNGHREISLVLAGHYFLKQNLVMAIKL